ncbi:MAG: acyl-CoA dehydrogenase family protein [Pseudomonadota bacterium]|nr:acyl-CoA dehydrogenase family protein [Pseudomonadota bacterium]
MDLSLTQEQRLLQDSIQKFISTQYSISERNKFITNDQGYDNSNWQQFADLGWLAMTFSEEFGGLGGSLVDSMIMLEEFGKGLVVEPFMSTVILFGAAVELAGSQEQKQAIIPAIIEGNLIGTFAYAEPVEPTNLSAVQTKATAEDSGFRLSGTKSLVFNAVSADKILLSARTSGGDFDTNGISLFIVDPSENGLTRTDYTTVDGLRASEIYLEQVRVERDCLLGTTDTASKLIQGLANRGILGLAAEAIGAMEALYKSTIEYTKQRQQFDHPLADFQVLKHRMTEMFVEYNLVKSLCMKATMLETQGTADAQRNIHALKYLVGKTGRFISQNAVQLHGGMGMTEDLPIAHYFKRLLVIDAQFGNTDHHLNKFVG